ncbi:MAG TPA: AAA family ATPase [Candidatus Sulfotelmatobacter sp.]|nr:AAA family ATPase [Candidatus Sulfotelmatobacter sp.]
MSAQTPEERSETPEAVPVPRLPKPSAELPVSTPTPAEAPHPAALPASPRPASPAANQIPVNEQELERHRIVARASRSINADTFRMLRTKLLQMMTRNNLRTIAITSPNYGDGKSTIAVNLALSLALDVKQTVLLVDLDLRNPDVHNIMGLKPDVGLSDYITHDAPVPSCMVKPAIDRLVVLPISRPIENSSEMLATPKMTALAEELKTRYSDRIVIYDMPPLLAQDDTIAFLPNVDGVLLVVRDGASTSAELTQCLHMLDNTNLLGTVLNACAEKSHNKN